MNRNEHIQVLAQQYQDLKRQYLHELVNGSSLAKIRDMSYVLDMLADEIRRFETESGMTGREHNRRHILELE